MLLICNIVIVIYDVFILILEASVLKMFAEPSLVKASVAKQ